jgi:hypothetical protein
MVKKIPLNSRTFKGMYALVDDEDYDKVKDHKWRVFKNTTQHMDSFYAQSDFKNEKGRWVSRYMHRIIMDAKKGQIVDHVDGNGLTNTRDNLRFVTVRQNGQNRHRNEASKYPGVCRHGKDKWRAQITFNKIMRHIGVYDTEEEAFEAYKKEVYELTGEELIFEGE